MLRWLLTLGVLSLTAVPTFAAGAERVAGQAEIDAALARHAASEAASRETVARLLERDDVRFALEGAGLAPRDAAAAVALLDGNDLTPLVDLAESFESDPAGGQRSTMGGGTGSYMPILYGLLIVALILVLVLA